MFVPNCKSVTKTISKTQPQLQELPLKQVTVMRKPRMAMVLKIRSFLTTQTDLLPTTPIMQRTNKTKKMTWRGQMMQRSNKSMMKKT